VALTRAEEQLYVISNMNLSEKEKCPKYVYFYQLFDEEGVLINCIMSLEGYKIIE
jgi:ATP-dependent exoDNAse (exonuclease V) beta subunit